MWIQKKIQSIMDNLHCKMVKWLCENYHVVLLPNSKCKEWWSKLKENYIAKLSERKYSIRYNNKNRMLTWSHYWFQQWLLFKAQEFPWCKVLIVDEQYTSKTCGNCGVLDKKLRSSKTFLCPSCHANMDWDANAARNILLWFLMINRKEPEKSGVVA
jgi:putative transposase